MKRAAEQQRREKSCWRGLENYDGNNRNAVSFFFFPLTRLYLRFWSLYSETFVWQNVRVFCLVKKYICCINKYPGAAYVCFFHLC